MACHLNPPAILSLLGSAGRGICPPACPDIIVLQGTKMTLVSLQHGTVLSKLIPEFFLLQGLRLAL